MSGPTLSILGIRGIPAAHGGFETFAEHLAVYLVQRGWRVTVYCQGRGAKSEDEWRGVRRVHIGTRMPGAAGTILFDLKSMLHATREPGVCLSLGYGTALFFPILRAGRRFNVVNMDGMEWKRSQWGPLARAWLRANEWLACRLGNRLVADHPEIERYLARHVREDRLAMVPYGAERIESADAHPLAKFGLSPREYALVVARPEKDNSILEIVRAFSARHRDSKLVVLGDLKPERVPYHRLIIQAASEQVLFPGAIYDRECLRALRYHARLYIHGHRVGGTNPSLVEALGASNPVLAHDNPFNRWVAGDAAHYFADERQCALEMDGLIADDGELKRLRVNAGRQFQNFEWDRILGAYENLLEQAISLQN